MFDFTDTRFTHMPFAAPGENGEPEQFCCIQNDGLWKIYHFTGQRWKRVKTGLPADATECGPCAEFADPAPNSRTVSGSCLSSPGDGKATAVSGSTGCTA